MERWRRESRRESSIRRCDDIEWCRIVDMTPKARVDSVLGGEQKKINMNSDLIRVRHRIKDLCAQDPFLVVVPTVPTLSTTLCPTKR